MRFHRTLIATAVTVGSLAGALALADPGRSDDPTGLAAPTSTASASTPTTGPVPTTERRSRPDEQSATPTSAVADEQAAVPAAVSVPDGAEQLGIELAGHADNQIATGPVAAAWLEQAPPNVRQAVADNLDTTPAELTEQLLDDPAAFLSTNGMVGYIEPSIDRSPAGETAGEMAGETAGEMAGETAGEGATAAPDVALASVPADVFALHSLASSTKVVYLDFDGHLMQNEYWNSAYGIGPFDNQPYDIDGIPSAFSDTERARILEIWQRVADDYAPFDIDVTTQDPGVDGLRRTSSGDTAFGSRVVITSSDWYATANGGTRIGGIALLNVFTSSTAHASYVFSSNLGSGHAKYVADATSHEAGHTLSLQHDGTATAGYYGGHGSWGPIMGTPYSRAVTQWSNGQYPGANNTTQDDLAEIGARGGFRSDDHANTTAGATAVSVGTRNGLIGSGADVDVFRFTPTGGSTQVTVTTQSPATNLLARLTVRDTAGAVVTQVEPSVASGWSLTTDVAASAGAFTVEVSPTSWLTPATGFVTYGSLGTYTITFTDSSSPTTTTTTTATTTTSTATGTTPTTTTSLPATTTSPTTTAAPPTTAATTSPPTTAPPPAPSPRTNGLALTAIAPQRLVDTRLGIGGQTRQRDGGIVRLSVAGRAGIPGDAAAIVANITVVEPSAPGYATIYPCTAAVPDVSVLNHATGQTVANNAISTLSAQGDVCVYTYAAADIIIDVTGWLGPSGTSRMVPVGPTRAADTRTGLGGSRRVAAGSTTVFDMRFALPPQSTAVAVNLTAVAPANAGYMTAFPCGRQRPATSSLNFAAGETRPNNAIVATDDDTICVYSDAEADILIDVTAAFGPNGLGLVPITPVRLLDTRRTAPLARSEVRSYKSAGQQLTSSTPRSASVNVTALDQPADGFVTTFDCITQRDTSTLNPGLGSVSANGAIVPLIGGDQSCLMSSTGGNLIVDLNGWWVP